MHRALPPDNAFLAAISSSRPLPPAIPPLHPPWNGEDLLHHLCRLKSFPIDRYTRYANTAAASANAFPFFMLSSTTLASRQRRASQRSHTQAQRATADEAAQWLAQEDAAARDYRYPAPPTSSPPPHRTRHPPLPPQCPSRLPRGKRRASDRTAALRAAAHFVRTPWSASTVYPTEASGAGRRSPSSAGVTFGGALSSYAPSYIPSKHSTPTPSPMPLRAAYAGEYEYDGESINSEVVAGRGGEGA
ncbi:hypothetical protein DFH09DRAFT_1301206 [Mycena vulgaris]|nr:hypothetical protein DFH09DRAFT_1301206 [Mycena vulgaris]